jgi:hypothetical protein
MVINIRIKTKDEVVGCKIIPSAMPYAKNSIFAYPTNLGLILLCSIDLSERILRMKIPIIPIK